MLDTDICVYVINETPVALTAKFNLLAADICISSITYGELEYGVANSARQDENRLILREFAARLTVLDFGIPAAEHFGDIRLALRRAGTPIGPFDMQIAAHARSLGLTLVTNNRREFDRVPGLRVENWA